MNHHKRALAMLIGMVFVLALFVSSAYIALESDHDCISEHCDICEHLAEARALLRSFQLVAVILLMMLALYSVHRHTTGADGIRLPARGSLVSWKVRLDN